MNKKWNEPDDLKIVHKELARLIKSTIEEYWMRADPGIDDMGTIDHRVQDFLTEYFGAEFPDGV